MNWGRREAEQAVPRSEPPHRGNGYGNGGGPHGQGQHPGYGANHRYADHVEPHFTEPANYHYPNSAPGPQGGYDMYAQNGGYPALNDRQDAYGPNDGYGGGGRYDGGPHSDQPYPPVQDPQYYDLNQYAVPNYPAQPGYGGAQGYEDPPFQGLQDYRQGPGQYDPRGGYYDEHPQTGFPPTGAPTRMVDRHGGDHPGHHDQAYGEDYDEYEDEEPPRRGRRVWFLTVALIGSIAVGGGLAFGYKTLVGDSGSKVSLVRAANNPTRVAPSEPGGRKVAGTDSKLMGRLEAEGTPGGAEQSDPSGVRKVSTFVVGRDGSVSPVAGGQGTSAGAGGTPDIPGFQIVDGFGGPPPAADGSAARPKVATRAPEGGSERPRIAVNKITTVSPDESPAQQRSADPAIRDQARAPAQEKRVASVSRPQPAADAEPAPTGARGYVAVLSSKGSRMDALQAFADMREKYPTVLGSKIPDVQTSDQSSRGLGVVYRAVAGPPGSRQAASAVCKQLKSAGHDGCWVTAY